jgi:cell division transport system permease protein
LSATKIGARISTVSFRSVEFLIQEAVTGIRRNGLMAFASISTIALSLAVLGAFVLMAMSANNFAAAQIDKFEIAVYVPLENKTALDRIRREIAQIRGVESIILRDRDQEWARLKQQRPDIEPAGLPLNPLPFTFDVRLSDRSRTTAIATHVRTIAGVEKVTAGDEVLNRLMMLARVVKVVSYVGAAALLVTSLLIISNAIRLTLYARRREIRIMQLVGATNQFIRIPLVIEGVVFGAVGALVAWLLLQLGSSYLAYVSQRIMRLATQFSSGIKPSELALSLLALGVAIGALGSLVSIRRFLHDQ